MKLSSILIVIYFMLTLLWVGGRVIALDESTRSNYLSEEVLEKSKLIDDNIDIEFLQQFEPAL